jgi:hypothetical protein
MRRTIKRWGKHDDDAHSLAEHCDQIVPVVRDAVGSGFERTFCASAAEVMEER